MARSRTTLATIEAAAIAALRVAIDDGLVRRGERPEPEAVDQARLGRRSEAAERRAGRAGRAVQAVRRWRPADDAHAIRVAQRATARKSPRCAWSNRSSRSGARAGERRGR